MTKRAEPIFNIQAVHGEGPVWDEQNQTLYWVDIPQGQFFKASFPAGSEISYTVGQAVGVLALRQQGGIVMAVRDGFGFYDISGRSLELIEPSPEQHNELVRFNDGAVDPMGRFFAGTMAWDEVDCLGKLFRLDPDQSWATLEHDLYITNGMGWSKDLSSFYMIDTLQHAVFAYDYDSASGNISNRRRFIEFPEDEYPDGMCLDQDDGFWMALYGKGKVVHFDASGQRLEEILVPVPHTTSCCFGGPEMRTLFITTSKRDLSEADKKVYPLAGRTFMVETNVTGKVEPRYRG